MWITYSLIGLSASDLVAYKVRRLARLEMRQRPRFGSHSGTPNPSLWGVQVRRLGPPGNASAIPVLALIQAHQPPTSHTNTHTPRLRASPKLIHQDKLMDTQLPYAITGRLAQSKCPAAVISPPPAPTTVTQVRLAHLEVLLIRRCGRSSSHLNPTWHRPRWTVTHVGDHFTARAGPPRAHLRHVRSADHRRVPPPASRLGRLCDASHGHDRHLRPGMCRLRRGDSP